jgi:hypothetical protein
MFVFLDTFISFDAFISPDIAFLVLRNAALYAFPVSTASSHNYTRDG